MHAKRFVSLLCVPILFLPGCKKAATTPASANPHASASPQKQQQAHQPKFDACGLLTKKEIEAVQGCAVREAKSSERAEGGLRVSQCFYTAAESNRSVSLMLTQTDPDAPTKNKAKDFWESTFGRYDDEEKQRESDKEKKQSLREQREKGEEEKAIPPKKITGVGDEAFWTGNRVGGALYVLKKDAFIRISVGGPDKEESKIDKSKALAQKALGRL